jgi:hypothetical protein
MSLYGRRDSPVGIVTAYGLDGQGSILGRDNVRRLLVTASVVPSSPTLVILMKEALSSCETSVLTRATRRNIPENPILHSHCRENLKSYIALTGWTLRRRGNVSPVKYEQGFYIPEDPILHSHRRENLKSYIALTGWTLQRRRNVSPVKYEQGLYIPEDDILGRL